MDDLNPYAKAGVSDERASALVRWLEEHGKDHHQYPAASSPLFSLSQLGTHEVSSNGFAAVFSPQFQNLQDPLFVTSTDGVGTKILLALEHDALHCVGQDLVAMCANDLFTIGARPLGFLDYYATSKLSETQFQQILVGIHQALSQCACTLVGGETAQMPGLYHGEHFDLAGFIFGVVDRSHMLHADKVQDGDLLFALPSSGFHANGFSLIRKWLDSHEYSQEDIAQLLQPTQLYTEVPYVIAQLPQDAVHACAHITGGGIAGNIVRSIPSYAQAHIYESRLPTSDWMQDFLRRMSDATLRDLSSIFNLGCGMIVVVDSSQRDAFVAAVHSVNRFAYEIGYISLSSNSAACDITDFSSVIFHD